MNPFQTAAPAKKSITLIGVYLGLFGAIFASSGLATALPAAAKGIGGAALYPLASTIAGLLSMVAMPLYGFIGARNPADKRLLFVASMVVGGVVSLARGLAPNMMTIVIASVFWAFLAAGVYVIGYSMIRDMYSQERSGTLLGVVGTIQAVGMLIGPAVTGFLIDNVSWRAVFLTTAGLLFAAAAVSFVGLRVSRSDGAAMGAGSATRFDLPGCIVLTLFMGGIVLSLSLGPSSSGEAYLPFGTLGNNLMLVVAALSLIALIVIVRKKGDKAVLPMSVLRNRNTLLLASSNALGVFSGMAVFFFIPTYVIYVMEGTATQAALTSTAIAAVGLFLGPLFGKAIGKAGNARGVLTLGTLIRIGITVFLALVIKPDMKLWLLYAIMLVVGVYNCQQGVTFATAPQIQLPEDIRVMGNSVVQLAQTIGGGFGLAVFTTVIGIKGPADGMPIALMIAIGTALVLLVLGLFLQPIARAGQPAAQDKADAA
ncbi:MAG: MFS transporter [Bifidobacteriaceae bacterium]|jgi:MFS family permease|nr:MFS transporter [Bifidobacteriaceae bacterium]